MKLKQQHDTGRNAESLWRAPLRKHYMHNGSVKNRDVAQIGDIIECTIEWPRPHTRRVRITNEDIRQKANVFLHESPDIWKLVKAQEL